MRRTTITSDKVVCGVCRVCGVCARVCACVRLCGLPDGDDAPGDCALTCCCSPQVAAHLFNVCIVGLLRTEMQAAVVLVTHQLQFADVRECSLMERATWSVRMRGTLGRVAADAERRRRRRRDQILPGMIRCDTHSLIHLIILCWPTLCSFA